MPNTKKKTSKKSIEVSPGQVVTAVLMGVALLVVIAHPVAICVGVLCTFLLVAIVHMTHKSVQAEQAHLTPFERMVADCPHDDQRQELIELDQIGKERLRKNAHKKRR